MQSPFPFPKAEVGWVRGGGGLKNSPNLLVVVSDVVVTVCHRG